MNAQLLQIDQASYKRLMSNLAELPRRVGLKVFRIALYAWTSQVKAEAVRAVKRGPTKALSKSLIAKVTIPAASYNAGHHDKPARAEVGPNRRAVAYVASVRGEQKRLSVKKSQKRLAAGGRFRVARPSRYAHFVEKGIAGKKRIAPSPFIAPAARAGASAGMARFTAKLTSGIAAEAAKLPK